MAGLLSLFTPGLLKSADGPHQKILLWGSDSHCVEPSLRTVHMCCSDTWTMNGVDISKHFSYYAMDGGTGESRWKHEVRIVIISQSCV